MLKRECRRPMCFQILLDVYCLGADKGYTQGHGEDCSIMAVGSQNLHHVDLSCAN